MDPTNFIALIGLMAMALIGMAQYLSRTLRSNLNEIGNLQRKVVQLRLKIGRQQIEIEELTEERDALRAVGKKLYDENTRFKIIIDKQNTDLANCLQKIPPTSDNDEDVQKSG